MWPFGRVEHRASATDVIVDALVSAAAGSGVPPTVEALGAVEAAAGLWSRAFASATVEPLTPTTRALTPSVLAAIGRGLAVRGEAVFELDVEGGGVELIQAASWKVLGGIRPESWLYVVDLPVPGGMVKRTLPADASPSRPLRNAAPGAVVRCEPARYGRRNAGAGRLARASSS